MVSAPSTVAHSAARGVVWAFSSLAGGKIIALASIAVLARILTPADFGLMAFSLLYITFIETMDDLGTSAALIYRSTRVEEAARVTFAISLVMGWVWFAATLAVAPLVADFFNHPTGSAVLSTLAWSFPLKALGSTHDALCRKDLRFGARAVPEVALAAVKAVVAIALALAGFGVWSLVWGQLAGVAIWTVMLWQLVPWRPDGPFPRDLVRPMAAYGMSAVAVNVLAATLHHVDLVIVGRTAGVAALGVYQMAARVPEVLLALPVWVAGRVLFPAFSRLRQLGTTGDVHEAYTTTVRYVALVTIPAAVVLIVLADPIVRITFGDRWVAAVPILRALALYGCLRSLGSPAGDVMKATGRPGLLAGLGLVKGLVVVPSLIVASRFGPEAVALTLAALTGGTALLNHLVVSQLMTRSPAAGFAALMPGTAVGAAVAMGAALIYVPVPGAIEPVRFLFAMLAAGCSAFLALRFVWPEAISTAIAALRSPEAVHSRVAGR